MFWTHLVRRMLSKQLLIHEMHYYYQFTQAAKQALLLYSPSYNLERWQLNDFNIGFLMNPKSFSHIHSTDSTDGLVYYILPFPISFQCTFFRQYCIHIVKWRNKTYKNPKQIPWTEFEI